MHAMSGIEKWGLPAPFYFLELLIGFVQAFRTRKEGTWQRVS